MLSRIDIENFKSIKKQTLELKMLNVLIGQNGAGKSNFISLFKFLERLVSRQMSDYIFKSGGINTFLFNGYENSEYLKISIELSKRYEEKSNIYEVEVLSNGEEYTLNQENIGFWNKATHPSPMVSYYGTSGKESKIFKYAQSDLQARFVNEYLKNLKVFHFHDTSGNAPIKQPQPIEDIYFFKNEADNLAPILFFLKEKDHQHYYRITEAVKLVYPQFKDFELVESPTAKGKIVLRWSEKGTEHIFSVKQISDGTLRFICLATLLSIPQQSAVKIPDTIVLDEPELGLHPYAIHVLAELLKKASLNRQIILATQSVTLINNFELENLIITERYENGETVFQYRNPDRIKEWLEDYTLGELWENNFLGGKP